MAAVARPYQPFTISGDGGFSHVNVPPTAVGSISCRGGTAWVRLLQRATLTQATDGANSAIVDPDSSPFTEGWALLQDGDVLTFGTELVHETTDTGPVGQIDVYSIGATVVCNQH